MSNALPEIMRTIAHDDFPGASDEFMALLPAAQAHLAGGPAKPFKLACLWFVQAHGQTWKRYELFKRYWALRQSLPQADANDESEGPDFTEMRELLYQWIVNAAADSDARHRALDRASDRPYWKLISTICPWPEHVRQDGRVEHHTHAFWANRRIPSAKLDCRCRFAAVVSV